MSSSLLERLITADVECGDHDPKTPYEDPAWRAEAAAWIAGHLSDAGLQPADSGWRVRLRPWSVIIRIPLARRDEPLWFKANAPASRFEAPLLDLLARLRPGDVLAPLAVDAERGWTLQPDGGPLFRTTLDADPGASATAWVPVVRQYAELQRATVGEVGRLAEIGVPLLTAKQGPEAFELIFTDPGLAADDRARLVALRPDFVRWCAELDAMGVPAALDHSDLHDAQIFGPEPGGRVRFFDFGDAVIGHPFGSLLVTGRVIRRRCGAEVDLGPVHDAYLDGWGDLGLSRAELRRAVTLAGRVAAVQRVLAWNRVFEGNTGGMAGWGAELLAAGDLW